MAYLRALYHFIAAGLLFLSQGKVVIAYIIINGYLHKYSVSMEIFAGNLLILTFFLLEGARAKDHLLENNSIFSSRNLKKIIRKMKESKCGMNKNVFNNNK